MKQKRLFALCSVGVLFAVLAVRAYAVDQKLEGAPSTLVVGNTGRYDRPIPMGVSISNTQSSPFIYAGTAGLKLRSLVNPSIKFILSNNHVLGAKGPTLCPGTAPAGTLTSQPGSLDIGADPGPNPFYIVGSTAGFWPLGGVNLIDAALSYTTDALAMTQIAGIGQPNPAVGVASPGEAVIKSGRTTGVTTGTVDSVNTTALVSYGASCGTFFFVGQTVITPSTFSGAGDSGSAILDAATKTPVGLLFAGSSQHTIANQIFWVYALLNVFMDTPSGPASVEGLNQMYSSVQARQDPRLARLADIQSRHEPSLFRLPGVRAVGIGRHENGRDFVLKVYGEKLTNELQRALPQQIEGIPVRFAETEQFTAR